jgi:hypothetical protein
METSDDINLFIVDSDAHYGQVLKRAFQHEFDERVNVECFSDGESCLQKIKNGNRNNTLVILDYYGNKQPEIKDGKSAIEDLIKINSRQGIIILSLKNYIDKSIRGPVHNTFDYVPSQSFAFDRMVNSVKKCLNIPRV